MGSEAVHVCETGLTVGGQTGFAPEWVQLAPLGAFTARDGRKFMLSNPELLIEAFRTHGADLPVDYEHQNDKETPNGLVPAAGWITELKVEDESVWGKVKWTETAVKLIAAREYRYLSPVLMCLKDGKITKVKGAALVHTPALQLKALAEEEVNMRDADQMINRIAELVGLPTNAPLEDFVAIIQELQDGREPSPNGSKIDPAKYAPVEAMRELMSEHSGAIQTLREQTVQSKVKTAQDAGYLTAGMVPWALELCRSDETSFDAFIAGTPPAFAHLLTQQVPSGGPASLLSEALGCVDIQEHHLSAQTRFVKPR